MSNFEELSKHQLILLTLLVSFVTSIATGIITFSLLQEAPVEITQTINRVVERTIEKVVPEEGGKTGEVVREVRVVSEEDLVLQSIDKGTRSIVRVKTQGFDGVEILAGLGFVVADGVIVMDARAFSQNSNYTVYFFDNQKYIVGKTYLDKELIFLKVDKPAGEKYVFYPATLGNVDNLKLGQTVIAIAGKSNNSVLIGRISQLEKTSEGAIKKIFTDIAKSRSQVGSPLLNINGEMVGIEAELGENDVALSYIPVSQVKISMTSALSELSK
jgi:hypothetical protein